MYRRHVLDLSRLVPIQSRSAMAPGLVSPLSHGPPPEPALSRCMLVLPLERSSLRPDPAERIPPASGSVTGPFFTCRMFQVDCLLLLPTRSPQSTLVSRPLAARNMRVGTTAPTARQSTAGHGMQTSPTLRSM